MSCGLPERDADGIPTATASPDRDIRRRFSCCRIGADLLGVAMASLIGFVAQALARHRPTFRGMQLTHGSGISQHSGWRVVGLSGSRASAGRTVARE